MITARDFAKMLDGGEYGREITEAEASIAKENGLVVVYGYSDDNMEFEGALHDEVGCYDGGTAAVTNFGVFTNERPDCPVREIKAVWCAPGKPAWSYETDIPHEKFNIYEDGELFCEGIVFSLEDV